MEGLTEDVTRELLRAKSLASLGCALHTRRALVALRRSRPPDTLVYHNINYVNIYTIIKTGGVTGFEEDWNCHSDKADFLSNRENAHAAKPHTKCMKK